MPLKYTDEHDRTVGAGRAEQEQGEVTGLETREATSWFTVDGAIEKIGFGYPQLRIYVICKLIVVSTLWTHCIAVRANQQQQTTKLTSALTSFTQAHVQYTQHTHSIHTGTRTVYTAQDTHRYSSGGRHRLVSEDGKAT